MLYKIVTKVLVNRMRGIITYCNFETQGSFIPNKLISNNVLIAYEILHFLKSKRWSKVGNFAFKLDMSKVYDRVEWDFLGRMMVHLGFHLNWATLIMRCVALITYSVGINKGCSKNFQSSRGLC